MKTSIISILLIWLPGSPNSKKNVTATVLPFATLSRMNTGVSEKHKDFCKTIGIRDIYTSSLHEALSVNRR